MGVKQLGVKINLLYYVLNDLLPLPIVTFKRIQYFELHVFLLNFVSKVQIPCISCLSYTLLITCYSKQRKTCHKRVKIVKNRVVKCAVVYII